MKIAIHARPGSFSDRWIEYCDKNNIPYKKVDCYSTDIIRQLKGCDGIMWHWDQNDYRSVLFAKQFTMAINKLGLKSFPDINTSWHFDDKVGQKYLLEAIGAPLVPSHVFYSKSEAQKWAESTTFPKVFKLRGGAGSSNVRLIINKRQANRLIRKAFSSGFKHINRLATFKDAILRFQKEKDFYTLLNILKGLARFLFPTEIEKMSGRQKGYIYFQDFIPHNDFDTRLYVIGNKCFGTRRYNRKKDFRASGSGILKHDPELFDAKCIKLAFNLSKKLQGQSLAFDFIVQNEEYKLVEISYCFPANNVLRNTQGFWDENLIWYEGKIIPQYFMIENFIKTIS